MLRLKAKRAPVKLGPLVFHELSPFVSACCVAFDSRTMDLVQLEKRRKDVNRRMKQSPRLHCIKVNNNAALSEECLPQAAFGALCAHHACVKAAGKCTVSCADTGKAAKHESRHSHHHTGCLGDYSHGSGARKSKK